MFQNLKVRRSGLICNLKYLLNASLTDELYGRNFGPCFDENVRALIKIVDQFMPGIRLERNMDTLVERSGATLSYQRVLDYLMQNGLLASTVLELFRSLEGITNLDLRESLKGCALLQPLDFRTKLFQGFAVSLH